MTATQPRLVNVRVGWALVCVGVVLGVVAAFMLIGSVGPAVKDALMRPACATPCSELRDLQPGRYLVFEEVGRSTSVGPFSSTTEGPPTISPADVTVTSASGRVLDVVRAGSSETIERRGAIYADVVSFRVPEAGRYRVTVAAPEETRIVVAPSLGRSFLRALPGLGVAAVGFVVGLTGVVFLIVAWIRRRTPDPRAT